MIPTPSKGVNYHDTRQVRNIGPGLAKNLKIKTVEVTIVAFDPIKEGQVWTENKLNLAKGSFYLMPNEEAEYQFGKSLLTFEIPSLLLGNP